MSFGDSTNKQGIDPYYLAITIVLAFEILLSFTSFYCTTVHSEKQDDELIEGH